MFTNHLAGETSPYLKQHAHNPVDWYPWGEEALERARTLHRPIFLSVGYSACHWCHVMEHESFEDPEVGQFLNEHFVSIKVDREERPDLDQIYMTAVQAMTGQGGWPMSMFLTPDGRPFYGGTYFPPDDRYGRPSFKRLLHALADAWQARPEEIERTAGDLTQHVQNLLRLEVSPGDLDTDLLRNSLAGLERAFDPVHGGFGSAPKFPHPMDLRLLLRLWKRFNDENALRMARLTLDRMAMGGIYDHLGGGFHRYSTDERWLAPHFEKMLYDNALLTVAYLEAFQATGEPSYRRVVEETLDYVLREMTSPEGPLYSTQDADSEGEEGKYFVWSAAEVTEILGKEAAEIFTYVYDITPEGNWEGKNILHRTKTDAQDVRLLNIDEAALHRNMKEGKKRLFDVRSRRIPPGRDDKVLTAWNGLMIDALSRAAAVLDRSDYASAAVKAAEFIWKTMRTPEGRFLRTYGAGAGAKLNAYLEDYTYLLEGLVSLYQATFDERWIAAALELIPILMSEFWDEEAGGFFYTGKSHEALLARNKDAHDNATPSGNAMAATALLRLGRLTGRRDLLDHAEKTLQLFHGQMEKMPLAAGQMLVALDFFLGPVDEIAVIGDPNNDELRQVLRKLRSRFLPNAVLASLTPGAATTLVLLKDKESKGNVTTYICRNATCQAPIVGPEV
jgi:uncharacterized protein YyaL (SSP411 family)